LDKALERSIARYGSYKVEPVVTELSVARLHQEVLKGDLVNIIVSNAVHSGVNEELIPIDIPLDKGLNGYRVAFIRADDQDRVNHVTDIAGLRQLRSGTGEHWNDVPIYRYNDIPLITGQDESLPLMLEHGRFDLFPRPATGVLEEYNTYRKQYPGLAIDQHLLIHYPLGMYAFVSKSMPRLAERIRYGLQEMQNDGSFDGHFDKYFAQMIADLRFPQRTIVELENPFLPTWAQIPTLEWRSSDDVSGR
jgi:hypothetical protein